MEGRFTDSKVVDLLRWSGVIKSGRYGLRVSPTPIEAATLNPHVSQGNWTDGGAQIQRGNGRHHQKKTLCRRAGSFTSERALRRVDLLPVLSVLGEFDSPDGPLASAATAIGHEVERVRALPM